MPSRGVLYVFSVKPSICVDSLAVCGLRFAGAQPALSVLAGSPKNPLTNGSVSGCQETSESEKLYDLGIDLLSRDLIALRSTLGTVHMRSPIACRRSLKGVCRTGVPSLGGRFFAPATGTLVERSLDRSTSRSISAKISTTNSRLEQAGGLNQDPHLPSQSPQKSSARTKAGWGFLIGGALLGGAGVAAMSVAQAFSGSVSGTNFDQWKWQASTTSVPSTVPKDAWVDSGQNALLVGSDGFLDTAYLKDSPVTWSSLQSPIGKSGEPAGDWHFSSIWASPGGSTILYLLGQNKLYQEKGLFWKETPSSSTLIEQFPGKPFGIHGNSALKVLSIEGAVHDTLENGLRKRQKWLR